MPTAPDAFRLYALMMDASFDVLGDCSLSTIDAIDYDRVDRKLTGVANACWVGVITEEQALLWAYGYWASAALMAIAADGPES